MLLDELAIPRLLKVKTIAVVGLSSDPFRASHSVAKYLQEHGYRILPINPTEDRVLGEKSYPSLLALPEDLQKRVELVDIFRKPQLVLPHVQEAIALKTRWNKLQAIWLQLGIRNEDAKKLARKAGITFIQDMCLMTEHAGRARG